MTTSDPAKSCPSCHEPRIGPFCEQCGHSYSVPTPTTSSSWYAVIAADRGYFQTSGVDTGRFCFPAGPARRVPLAGESVRIGRRSESRGITPEIDLSDPPADPGVSREHARLLAQPDGTWAVVDDGSLNGTFVNGGDQRIVAAQQTPLADGDRVQLGLWTTITLRRDDH